MCAKVDILDADNCAPTPTGNSTTWLAQPAHLEHQNANALAAACVHYTASCDTRGACCTHTLSVKPPPPHKPSY